VNLSASGLIDIVVHGQNGIIVDGERVKYGAHASWETEEGEEVTIDLHGANVCITVEGLTPRKRVKTDDDDDYKAVRDPSSDHLSSPLSSPTKSSPMSEIVGMTTDDDDDDDDIEKVRPTAEPEREDTPEPVDQESIGSLASAIVFHPRSTVFFSEAVAALRSSQPSLAHLSSHTIARLLGSGPFGEIPNNGLKVGPHTLSIPDCEADKIEGSSRMPTINRLNLPITIFPDEIAT
jgi:hypothetical protein